MQLWYDSAIAFLGIYPRVMKPGFPGGVVVKNLPANAGDARDTGLIPGSGRDPLEKEMATHSSVIAWEIPWTEESGGLWSMGSQKSRMW